MQRFASTKQCSWYSINKILNCYNYNITKLLTSEFTWDEEAKVLYNYMPCKRTNIYFKYDPKGSSPYGGCRCFSYRGVLCAQHNAAFVDCCDCMCINITKDAVQSVAAMLFIQNIRGSGTCYFKGSYSFFILVAYQVCVYVCVRACSVDRQTSNCRGSHYSFFARLTRFLSVAGIFQLRLECK
jgi:hypothetical protein